jgi:hypothetical protein
MNDAEPIVNRVASSGLITLNLEDYYHKGDREVWDMAEWLFQGLILKEKDFRMGLKEVDWNSYAGKNMAVTCSGDAIIPTWAYMLVVQYLAPVCNKVVIGSMETLEYALFRDALTALDPEDFRDARVVVKGCGDLPVPDSAYGELTSMLVPVVTSLMFGEPCSTVPVYKKPRNR